MKKYFVRLGTIPGDLLKNCLIVYDLVNPYADLFNVPRSTLFKWKRSGFLGTNSGLPTISSTGCKHFKTLGSWSVIGIGRGDQ